MAVGEAVDHHWLQETFGDQLAFYGGISTQTVLPSGSPAELRAAVGRCVEALAPRDTGMILAPSHRLMTDIPLRNIDALLEALDMKGAPE